MGIKNIKCYDEDKKIRLTFDWPAGVGEVYVNGMLFTLQEYKTRGGFITEKLRGRTVYYISDSDADQGDSICFIEKTFITCKIRGTGGFGYDRQYNNYEVILTADYPVPAGAVCYVKKKNAAPVDIADGVLYCFGQEILPGRPLKRVIRTLKNEHIRMFVCEEYKAIYELENISVGYHVITN